MSLQKVTYAFIPTAITGCVLWMDAADSNTITLSSTAITQWNDKSASTNHFVQATTANSPTVGTSANGLPTIYFATTNQQLVSSQNSATSGNASRTVIQVFWCPTLSSAYYSVTGTESSGNPPTAWGHAKNPNADVTYPFMYSSVGDDVFTVVNSTPNPLITYAQYNSTGSSFSSYYATSDATNGTTTVGNFINKTMTFNTTAGVWYLGRRQQAATGSVTSHLLEMIHFNKALSATERQQVESYLAQKWGLKSSLPLGHPGLGETIYKADYRKTNIMKAVPYFTQFSPRQIAGCSHWFDATDSSTITLSSGSLTQWNDKSGNGRNLTAVAGFANATVSSGYQNGLNVFNFFGNGLYRTAGGNVSYPLEVYIIVALKSLTTHVDVLGMGDTSTDNFNSLTFAESAASKWHNGSSGGGRQTISLTTETSLSFLLIQWSIANGNYLLRRNGTELIQASRTYSFNNSATAIFQIGYRHTDNVYGTGANFSGYIGEIIVFNNQIGTTDRQNVESYLTQKWGLVSSLPGGHLHLTKQAGAITQTALSKFRMTSIPKASLAIPQTIAGLAMWLDATKITGFANGATLTSWTDSIGNLSFSNVNGVTYQTSIMNGLPAVYMNGPGPYLEYSGTPPALVSGGTIFAVVQNNADGLVQPNYSGATFQVLWQMNGYANGWEGYPYNFNNTTVLGSLATTRRTWGYPFSTTYFKSPHIVKVVSTTNNWVQSFIQTATSTNASFTDTSASTPTLSAPMRLGASMDGPGLCYYKGYFAEIILYNRGLSAPEQTTIENYLKTKWNV